jgi:hypothetical protein
MLLVLMLLVHLLNGVGLPKMNRDTPTLVA